MEKKTAGKFLIFFNWKVIYVILYIFSYTFEVINDLTF